MFQTINQHLYPTSYFNFQENLVSDGDVVCIHFLGSARRGARMRGALGANEKKHFCRRYFRLILSFFYIVGLEKQTLDAKGPKTS